MTRIAPSRSHASSADAEALAACGVAVADFLIARPASAPDALLMLTILARCRALDARGFLAVPALRDLPAGRVQRRGPVVDLRVAFVAAWAIMSGDEAVYWPHATDTKEARSCADDSC